MHAWLAFDLLRARCPDRPAANPPGPACWACSSTPHDAPGRMRPARLPHGPFNRPIGGTGMDALWWVPIGLVVWSGVSLAAGLWLGPVLRYCSRVREAVDAHT